ncbi:MAG TPA: archease [Thermoplasmata archaeon]|nr:archease [Thermoplasmata archaeon]
MPGPPRARRHGSFPTTADLGIWARAPTADALYEELAEALVGVMTDRRKLLAKERRSVAVTADDPLGLAVAFLSELVVLFQVDGFLARSVRVRATGRRPLRLRAELAGETFDPDRHPRRIEVKAVTLHAAVFDPAGGLARIILDI